MEVTKVSKEGGHRQDTGEVGPIVAVEEGTEYEDLLVRIPRGQRGVVSYGLKSARALAHTAEKNWPVVGLVPAVERGAIEYKQCEVDMNVLLAPHIGRDVEPKSSSVPEGIAATIIVL